MALRQRLYQLRIHAVSGPQIKFALRVIEDVDRTGLGAGELHRLGNNGRQNGFEVECRVYRLRHLAERPQFFNGLRKLFGSGLNLIE